MEPLTDCPTQCDIRGCALPATRRYHNTNGHRIELCDHHQPERATMFDQLLDQATEATP